LTALPATPRGRRRSRRQRLPQRQRVRRHEQLPGHRPAEVAVVQLHQLRVDDVGLVAQEGQVVLVAARALALAGEGEQAARLAEQVEREVEQRDVLLELRASAPPTR
jgi:lactam utilization protein B